MKRSRVVVVAGASAAMLAAGWRVGSLPIPSLVLADSAGEGVSAGLSPSPSVSASSSVPSPSPTAAATTAAAPVAAKPVAAKPAVVKPAGPTGVYVGPMVSTAYGNMQVRLAINNGKITQVQPLVVGLGDSTSRRINASAVPQLQRRVLASQTWKVSYVSGASYTSKGILASVRGAMAKAGL